MNLYPVLPLLYIAVAFIEISFFLPYKLSQFNLIRIRITVFFTFMDYSPVVNSSRNEFELH